MITDRHWWVFFILLFAVVSTTWLTFTISDKKPMNLVENDVMDTFATQVHISNMDKTGHLSTQIYTPSLTHYTKDNRTQLDTPMLILHVKDQPVWQVNAKTAELKQGTDEIQLHDQVTLHQEKGKHNEEITVQTDALTVYPERKLAMTEHPITLLSHSAHVNAVGMQADMEKGTLELKTSARAQYEIPQH
ncbi:MAG: LPS export ABC transporter periplasmic protein LptC [Gammaproteobacteria bacterium]|nr:LPS export ABC transporter periplasmic protein LptC [Gammaproteobacteria bacterium]